MYIYIYIYVCIHVCIYIYYIYVLYIQVKGEEDVIPRGLGYYTGALSSGEYQGFVSFPPSLLLP